MNINDSSVPRRLEPILAQISTIGELGKSTWYEVVYHDGTEWCSYSGSDTFKEGETVLQWQYCSACL